MAAGSTQRGQQRRKELRVNVVLSVGTRLGAGGLGGSAAQVAEALAEPGWLRRVICAGLHRTTVEPGLSRVITTNWIAWTFFHSPLRWRPDVLTYCRDGYFDWRAKKHLIGADLFYGMSQCVLLSMQEAASMGMTTVLDSANCHLGFLFSQVSQEGQAFGLRHDFLGRRTVERALREYELAAHIRVLSTLALETFVERGIPEERITVIPPGVDCRRFCPGSGKQDDVFRIGFVGQVCLRKGIQYLLAALEGWDAREYELLIDGGSGDPVCRKLLDGYRRRVNLRQVDSPRVEETYRSLSVLVLPSVEDGFGMVVGEAMACGVPVIATQHVGAKDIVREGETGFIIPPRDVDSLADRLRYLYRHPDEARRMGARAARDVRALEVGRIKQKIVDMCERLVGGKRACGLHDAPDGETCRARRMRIRD